MSGFNPNTAIPKLRQFHAKSGATSTFEEDMVRIIYFITGFGTNYDEVLKKYKDSPDFPQLSNILVYVNRYGIKQPPFARLASDLTLGKLVSCFPKITARILHNSKFDRPKLSNTFVPKALRFNGAHAIIPKDWLDLHVKACLLQMQFMADIGKTVDLNRQDYTVFGQRNSPLLGDSEREILMAEFGIDGPATTSAVFETQFKQQIRMANITRQRYLENAEPTELELGFIKEMYDIFILPSIPQTLVSSLFA